MTDEVRSVLHALFDAHPAAVAPLLAECEAGGPWLRQGVAVSPTCRHSGDRTPCEAVCVVTYLAASPVEGLTVGEVEAELLATTHRMGWANWAAAAPLWSWFDQCWPRVKMLETLAAECRAWLAGKECVA